MNDHTPRGGERIAAGVDLGGTSIKVRIVHESGAPATSTLQADTEAVQGVDHVLQRIVRLVDEACRQENLETSDLAGVGVATPGPLDLANGTVRRAANLPGWRDVPVVARLEDYLQRPVALLNDANAACYGEFKRGGGAGARDLILLTLGTGVGGGVISGGSLVEGAFGNAGELGHVIVRPDGPECSCGQRGCLEVFAGGWALERRAVQAGICPSAGQDKIPHLVAQAGLGDEAASAIWDEACRALGIACVTFFHAFNPTAILLGGGVSAAGSALLDPVRAAFDQHIWHLSPDRPRIDLANLGNGAGVIGAAHWFLDRIST